VWDWKTLSWFSACSGIELLEESILFVWMILIYRCISTRFLLWKNVSKSEINHFSVFQKQPGQNGLPSLPHYLCYIIQVLFWFSVLGGLGESSKVNVSWTVTSTRLCHFLFKDNPTRWFTSRFLNYYISSYSIFKARFEDTFESWFWFHLYQCKT